MIKNVIITTCAWSS